jgi:Ser/Thr protein kinase RdoA (MazF antagonist)
VHGLNGEMERPDWPPLALAEVDAVLRRFPAAGGAVRILSVSPRPFSSGGVVQTPRGPVFVKRHARAVRDVEGLLEEHRLLAHLAGRLPELVQAPLANVDGETAVAVGEWTYEVHPVARGEDVYREALSWTPFLRVEDARAAGRALGRLHLASAGYDAPARMERQLVSSFTVFAGDPIARMERYLSSRPLLRAYAEERDWRGDFERLLLPLYSKLEPSLAGLTPLWTHNDFHASNLMWSGAGADAEVTGIIDFGLSDRTNAVHDLATAIERNVVEWLRAFDAGDDSDVMHVDQLIALLDGYCEVAPLSYEEGRALVAMLPLVHCEFALSETDYFLSVLGSREKAWFAYEGYFLRHAEWFSSACGLRLLEAVEQWIESGAEARTGVRA